MVSGISVEEQRLQKERVRVYALARELDVESKDLLDLCKQAGFDVKNQLSNLEPEQVTALRELIKRGPKAVAAAPVPTKPVTPVLLPEVGKAMPNLTNRPRREVEAPRPPAAPAPQEIQPAAGALASGKLADRPAETTSSKQPPREETKPVVAAGPAAERATPAPPSKPPAAVPGDAAAALKTAEPKPGEPKPPPAAGPAKTPAVPVSKAPPILSSGRPGGLRPAPKKPVMHAGFGHPVPPPTLRPMKTPPKKVEAVQQPIGRLTQDQLVGSKPIRPEDVVRPASPGGEVAFVEEEDDGKGKGKKPSGVVGRDKRKVARNKRAEERKGHKEEVVVAAGGKLKILDDDRPTPGHKLRKTKHRPATAPRLSSLELQLPITVRSLSEVLGKRSVELLFKLRDHGAAPTTTINSIVEPSLAEVVALEYGLEIDIKKPLDAEDQLLASFNQVDKPEDLVPRAPVVTIMGHVDHGKTSLLDKIRASNVVATEAGGITQVIRAWRVEHGGRPITFLDTPGHEAFTKMRARGAQVTDIAVIVVAADDGVMPQTEEAINHAKAAGVSLVVGINKVDLPSANVNKTRQQLYSLNVLPDNMGGDAPFVETSAATGKGIDELLDQLSLVAELKELKANPNKAARGTCLEAMLSEGEGVRATLLVREGTLRRGDVIVCGAAYGRIRQMYDDLGRSIQEAGPSVPARITGLDDVPNADDTFYVLPDLAVARSIAEKRKAKQQEAALVKRTPLTLETLTEAKIAELKVILKADFRGSIEAIRKELEKLKHEEVRVRVLEAGIGAITENDVWLALTSPEDTIIVGFNVVPDDRALTLAEEKGIKIREYDIIYNLTNDIRAALEGKLKPREEVVHLGRAVVRETFKISRVGTIAGCYVTQGTIKRNSKVRLIREGMVIFPPAERTASLESLKRFKEDVGEVREGFECGIKIAGYDDIKVGDVIEAFRIDQIQRTL
jgi:translation initiation factor IF-2